MQAVGFRRHGGTEVLERWPDWPDPGLGPGQALVRVRAVGLNRLDLMTRAGLVPGAVRLPHIPGSEVAGELVALGPGSAVGMPVGSRVAVAPYLFCGHCEYCRRGKETLCRFGDILGLGSQGGYAELVAVPAHSLVPLPDAVGYPQAAAVGLATITAWHMLMDRVKIRPGQWVFVWAAGSGVGSAAVQVARLAGARVIAAAGSDAKAAAARERLGAEVVVNYQSEDVAAVVRRVTGKRGVDVVVEHLGQATWETSLAMLARGGTLVTCGSLTGRQGAVDIWNLFAKELRVVGAYGGTRQNLAEVLQLVAEGRLQAVIDQVYPLDQAASAQNRLEQREVFGKLVLQP